jgi:hypothetical protein
MRKGLNFSRGLLVVIGGFGMFYGITVLVFLSLSFGSFMSHLFVTLIAACILVLGFKKKKS